MLLYSAYKSILRCFETRKVGVICAGIDIIRAYSYYFVNGELGKKNVSVFYFNVTAILHLCAPRPLAWAQQSSYDVLFYFEQGELVWTVIITRSDRSWCTWRYLFVENRKWFSVNFHNYAKIRRLIDCTLGETQVFKEQMFNICDNCMI